MYLQKRTFIFKDINTPLTITDPCYDKGTWCRIDDIKIKEGTYRFDYYTGISPGEEDVLRIKEWAKEFGKPESEEMQRYLKDIRSRVFALCIQPKGRHFSFDSPSWKKYGEIGVDAGVAGFFWNKPDFNDAEWSSLCDFMSNERRKGKVVYSDPKFGIWADSGYGDGEYPVSIIKENNEIIAIKIEF